MKFLPYDPNQAWLLPPSVKDVLGEDHLCFLVHRVVERLDLSAFESEYGEEGRLAYHPALRVKVWLYAYALQVTASRRLEQRVREDLAFRYLAGGGQRRQRLLLRVERGGAGNARHPGFPSRRAPGRGTEAASRAFIYAAGGWGHTTKARSDDLFNELAS